MFVLQCTDIVSWRRHLAKNYAQTGAAMGRLFTPYWRPNCEFEMKNSNQRAVLLLGIYLYIWDFCVMIIFPLSFLSVKRFPMMSLLIPYIMYYFLDFKHKQSMLRVTLFQWHTFIESFILKINTCCWNGDLYNCCHLFYNNADKR